MTREYYTAKYERSKLVYLQFIASQAGETAQVKDYQAKIDALTVTIEAMELEQAHSDTLHLAELKK